jgi:stage II sporulation protein AB (anti-sigma F factor)
MENYIQVKIPAISENEALARNVAVFYALKFNPSVSDVSDIKTAVSEAVTNSIVHGYPDKVGNITMECYVKGDFLHINVLDEGVGIKDVNSAIEPFFTTRENEEHSGMGFTIMKSFMDNVNVVSKPNEGVKVYMSKKLKAVN